MSPSMFTTYFKYGYYFGVIPFKFQLNKESTPSQDKNALQTVSLINGLSVFDQTRKYL